MKTSTNILIGIDDTDNKESRGTGFRAREMADLLMNDAIGTVIGISRHQLFVHPEIPYTSQNSSACLEVETSQENNLVAFCRDYLLRTCAEGSDAGLCVARADRVSEPVLLWGYSAKTEVLAMNRAEQIAYSNGIILEGLTGEKIGIIGALAAVGLRKSGNDGRFIWLSEKNLRELNGIFSANELYCTRVIDVIKTINGSIVKDHDLIDIGDWVRPVIINNKKIFFVEEVRENENIRWKAVSKDYIRSVS